MPNGCEASCQDLMLNKKGDGRWKALLTGWGSLPQSLPPLPCWVSEVRSGMVTWKNPTDGSHLALSMAIKGSLQGGVTPVP